MKSQDGSCISSSQEEVERRDKGKGVGRRGEGRRAAFVHLFFAGVCCVSDTGEQMMCPTHAPSPGAPSLAGRGQQGN